MGPKIAIPHHSFDDVAIEVEIFEEFGAELVFGDAETKREVLDICEGAEAMLVSPRPPIDKEVLSELEDLKVVARFGIGVDNVDVDAATKEGIVVVNVPAYCLDELSTHALALLLACLRKVPQLDQEVKNGVWDWRHGRPIRRFAGSTVGFAAFGKIPRELAEKLSGFDVDLIAHDPYVSDEMDEYGVKSVDFETLLTRSDVVSVHTPLTDETRHLFDSDAFQSMRDHAILVNTARGGVVDESALLDALTNGEIAGAGLDVMEQEPPEESPLFNLDSVVLTPHIGFYSEESVIELRRSASNDVIRVLRGERPEGLVNPEVYE